MYKMSLVPEGKEVLKKIPTVMGISKGPRNQLKEPPMARTGTV